MTRKDLLYIQTIQTETFKAVFETLREIIQDCNIIANEDGLRILMMDSIGSTLVHLKFHAENFDEYICNAEQMTLGVSVQSIYSFFKDISKNDVLTMRIEEGKEHLLYINFDNPDYKSSEENTYKLLDIEEHHVPVPDVEFDSICRLSSAFFQRILRSYARVSDSIIIGTSGSSMIFSSDGDFGARRRVIGETTSQNGDGIFFCRKTQNDEIIEGRYPIKSLLLFAKAANIHPSVEIFIKKDFPIIIQYQHALGHLRFCLVPMQT